MRAQNESPRATKNVDTEAAIAPEFRPLYVALDETLRKDTQAYPFNKERARPLVAGNLGLAWSMFDPAPPDSRRWKDLLATLDSYKTLGMTVAFFQIEAPDLSFGDRDRRIDFYQRLAREIHSRNMKVYVEHYVNAPFKPNLSPGRSTPDLHDTPQGRQEFLNLMEDESAVIYRDIKPDYLTLIDEPAIITRRLLHLTFSADELADWVGKVSAHLKGTGASANTLLGAGALTWEPEEYW